MLNINVCFLLLLTPHQVRVKDSKGSVDEDLGSWRFPIAKLLTLSQMRIPTQVNTSYRNFQKNLFTESDRKGVPGTPRLQKFSQTNYGLWGVGATP